MAERQKSHMTLSTQRLEAFSDSIFAIVMTLLFLELHVPEIKDTENWRELLDAMLAARTKFLSIVVSFAFVAIFWVAHHQFFHTLEKTTRGLLWLNLGFLFLVCFVPFPAAVMMQYPNNVTSVVFFGAAVLLTSILLSALRWYAWIKHKDISGAANDSDVRKAFHRSLIMIGLYMIGLTVSFFHPLTALVLYLLTPITLLFPVSIQVATENNEGEEEKTEIVM